MDKHTPGPWWVSAAKDCVWHADHGRICTPPNHAQVWNWEPNARLIAAAPDLLEALKTALKALDAIGDEMTVGERYTNAGQYLIDALPPVRAAIAKATEGATC